MVWRVASASKWWNKPSDREAVAEKAPAPPRETGAETKESPARQPTGRRYTAEVRFGKTTLSAMEGVARAWDIDAAQVKMDEARQFVVAKEVRGVFYADREIRATVVSKGADVNMATKDILFHGEVTITTPRGEKAWSRYMRWDGARQRLIGWDGVRLLRGNAVIRGEALEADPSFRDLIVQGNVTGVF